MATSSQVFVWDWKGTGDEHREVGPLAREQTMACDLLFYLGWACIDKNKKRALDALDQLEELAEIGILPVNVDPDLRAGPNDLAAIVPYDEPYKPYIARLIDKRGALRISKIRKDVLVYLEDRKVCQASRDLSYAIEDMLEYARVASTKTKAGARRGIWHGVSPRRAQIVLQKLRGTALQKNLKRLRTHVTQGVFPENVAPILNLKSKMATGLLILDTAC